MPKEFDANTYERLAIIRLCKGVNPSCTCEAKGLYCDAWLSAVRHGHDAMGERTRLFHNRLTGRMREPPDEVADTLEFHDEAELFGDEG